MSDIHVKVLKFGRDNPGFSIEQLKNKFPEDFEWIYREYQHSRLFQTDDIGEAGRFFLSFDDRSKLLEYEELRDARRSSKQAMWVAIISILLTLSSFVYQIFTIPSIRVISEKAPVPIVAKTPNK